MKTTTRSGFSLIEMLVIIVLVSIFVAVILAVNPLEQMNKARDSQAQATAKELHNAVERYYSETNPPAYPWNADADGYTAQTTDPLDAFILDGTSSTANWNWLSALTNLQELNSTSVTLLKLSRQYKVLHATGYNTPTYVCFYPRSVAMRKTADTYCLENSDTLNRLLPNTCASTTGSAPTDPGTNPICVP